ncbi:tRNA pseudouridine(38-40) synthase TruA [Nocardioides okcheonensis]|uniref:tRNA pseudouridine(38-40) synthase TruA n=1 Tax=Nocardioides okcheonensis TaxID=2894081 RepID=UPI001E2CDF03|nr:tRNA pseudouridine(38-40) synthase TruA [Nocardioides okcheonensis]UFN43825.1 tRNA pseudouridine(38-40) synthase TruA [Nocardioides okcheonensis]
MRLRIDCAYDGTEFSGWAAQPTRRTVQGTLEAALATALRQESARVTVAGRTDAGVHARGQVAHLDVEPGVVEASAGRSTDPPLEALARRVDGILPPDLRVRRISEAPVGFDARFSAVWRRYAYRIADDRAVVDPLTRGHVLAWGRRLDLAAMNEASAALLGLRDFAAFCKQREGATTVRTLLDLDWRRDRAGVAVGTVRADAFCHNMVRALVGSLIAVGEGRRPVDWPAEVMAGRRRDQGVRVVHAHGLTLEEVGYPDDAELAAQADRARARREAIDA